MKFLILFMFVLLVNIQAQGPEDDKLKLREEGHMIKFDEDNLVPAGVEHGAVIPGKADQRDSKLSELVARKPAARRNPYDFDLYGPPLPAAVKVDKQRDPYRKGDSLIRDIGNEVAEEVRKVGLFRCAGRCLWNSVKCACFVGKAILFGHHCPHCRHHCHCHY